MEPLVRNKNCLVLGSAPDVVMPKIKPQAVMAANGGVGIARKHSFLVDVLLTTSHICREGNTESEKESLRQWENYVVKSAWIDTVSGPVSMFVNYITELKLFCDYMTEVKPAYRAGIVRMACDDGNVPVRVSTGVFGVCLAAISQPKHILVAGISTKGGHWGSNQSSPRDHLTEDIVVLKTVAKRLGNKISTTSRELSASVGMRLA